MTSFIHTDKYEYKTMELYIQQSNLQWLDVSLKGEVRHLPASQLKEGAQAAQTLQLYAALEVHVPEGLCVELNRDTGGRGQDHLGGVGWSVVASDVEVVCTVQVAHNGGNVALDWKEDNVFWYM